MSGGILAVHRWYLRLVGDAQESEELTSEALSKRRDSEADDGKLRDKRKHLALFCITHKQPTRHTTRSPMRSWASLRPPQQSISESR